MQSAGAAEELRPGDGSKTSEQVMLSSGATAVSQQHAGSCADVSSRLNAQVLGTGGCVSALALCDVVHDLGCGQVSAWMVSGLFSLLSPDDRGPGHS